MVIHTISDNEGVATDLASRIIDTLPPHKTGVLLLSGGSCVPLEVLLSQKLPEMKNLHVVLVDERYGAVGHTNSNWAQLTETNFHFEKFTSHPTLQDENDLATTVSSNQAVLRSLLERSDYTIAILGMGKDGHTAGLLPHSQALESTDLYTDDKTEEFHRLTITPPVFKLIDYAVIYTAGEEKRRVLDKLDLGENTANQPIQLIKQCREFVIYNLIKES